MPTISLAETNPGIAARDFVVDGLKIRAFYDGADRLLAALDMTRDDVLQDTLLVIDDRDGRKWDDILKNDFRMDPEIVRPRANNKYQKLDIAYEGLEEYNFAIQNRNATALREWRMDQAARQRDIRNSESEREIDLARRTIGEASKTIEELEDFIKLQKEKLRDAKKFVGKVPPKESAEKILRYESRIERANAKKARSTRRLRRAEKRIASAAKNLNNYKRPIGREIMSEEVKPLFTQEPKIIDNANAFRPVSFAPATFPAPGEAGGGKSPLGGQATFASPGKTWTGETAPIPTANLDRPQAPISGNVSGREIKITTTRDGRGAGGGAYYLMLTLLIGLSIFTLYLYQKKLGGAGSPNIAATTATTVAAEPAAIIPETISEPEPVVAPIETPTIPDSIPAENPFIEEAHASVPVVEIEQEIVVPTEPTIEIDEFPDKPESDEIIEETTLEYEEPAGTFESE